MKDAFIQRSLDMLDAFFIEQQIRVARQLQGTMQRVLETRRDEMNRHQIKTETIIRGA